MLVVSAIDTSKQPECKPIPAVEGLAIHFNESNHREVSINRIIRVACGTGRHGAARRDSGRGPGALGTGNRFICSAKHFDDIFLFVLMCFASETFHVRPDAFNDRLTHSVWNESNSVYRFRIQSYLQTK